MEDKEQNELTTGQQNFFESNVARIEKWENEKNVESLAKHCRFLLRALKEQQQAFNKAKAEHAVEIEKKDQESKKKSETVTKFSKAFGVMTACYRAIDRNFGNEIRERVAKNDRTQKEGNIRALMEQMKKITGGV